MNGWRDEFWPLVDCAEDAPPSVELAAQFEQTLSMDESARRLYLEHVQLQAEIFLLLRSRRTLDKTLHQIDQLRAAPPNPPSRLPAFVAAGLKSLSQPLHFSLFFSAVTIVSLGLFFAQIHGRTPAVSSPPPRPAVEPELRPVVARLGRARDVVWADSAQPFADRAFLREGEQLALRSGWVEVHFDSGASLMLAGPARFRASDSNGGALQHGALLAHVPQPAVGFQIVTPKARVIDRGTEFALAVDDAGAMEVCVFDGQVEVVRPEAKDGRLVNRGQTLTTRDAEWRIAPTAPPAALTRLREQRAALATEKPGVRFRVTSLPPGSGEESLVAPGHFVAGLNIGREAPALVVNGLAFAGAEGAASQTGVTLSSNVLNVGGRLEKDLPSGSWKGPLAELMSSGAGSPIGGKFDVSVGGLTVGQEYAAVFYCAHAIGERGKRRMRIVSGEDASAFFEISAANLELCPIYVVAARFTAAEPAQIFTLQADARSRAVVCGVAIFSHD